MRSLSTLESIGQCTPQANPELVSVGVSQAFCRRNDDVVVEAPENFPLNAETFPNLALNLVSLDGSSASLQRDAQTKVSQFVGDTENGAFPQTKYFRAIKKSPVFPRVMKPMSAGKCLGSFF
jgi:hypothetical protein